MKLHHQFRVIDALSDFSAFRLIILPDAVEVDEKLAEKLDAFRRAGGKVLLSYRSGLGLEDTLFEHALRVRGESIPWKPHFIRLARQLGAGPEDFDFVMYEDAVDLAADKGVALAEVVQPYFNRERDHFCSHSTTPPEAATGQAEIIDLGDVIYIASAIFRAYRAHGNGIYKAIVARCIDRLLPQPILRTNAPTTAEVNVLSRKDTAQRVVHVLHYAPQRRTQSIDIVEDALPLVDLEIALRADQLPSRVYVAPSGEDVAHEFDGERVRIRIPKMEGYMVVVVE